MRRVPRRITAVIDRAQSALRWQGRVISANSFRHDVEMRLASLFPYVSVPENWRLAYSSLYTAKFHNKEWHTPESMELDDLGHQLIHTLEKDGRTSFESVWQSLAMPQKRFQWPRLTLWWLHKSPKLVLDFLLATDKRPHPPFAMVVDCMVYIYKFHYDEIDKAVYQSVISTCMDPERWPTVGLSQQGVRLYLLSSDLEGISRVFKLMRQRDSQISAGTLLCFMNLFTKYGDVDRAIDALRLIPLLNGPDSSLHSEQVMRHCCKLLMLDAVQDKDGVRNFNILPKLLELGVRPNREMMNVVLANAFKTGDPQLGQDMLKYMRDHGLEPDSYTYLTLLKDAVARGDRGRVDAVMQEINPKEELKRNPYIASKIFHAHFTFAAKHVDSYADPAGVFLSMLDLYSRFYDLTPLKELRIVPPAYTPFEQGANAEPPAASLYIMLATYLRCKKNSDRAYSLYQRFRELALEGNKIIAPLIQFEQFFNEFLYAFRDDPHALPRCVEVVEDMMHPDPRLATVGEDNLLHAKPTVYTWNILLSAFIYNRQPHAAEKVKEMMKKHGVGYDHTTWNTIISGYANAQDVQATAAAIKDMESHGYTIDSFTLNPLRFLKDPERLRVAIDTLDQKTLEAAQQEQVAEEQEREELLEQGLRRLAAARKQGKS
jgi:pentatricopeptide repeat protein